MEEEKVKNKFIVVTGFGPFRGFELINPSWEAVRLLPDTFEHNSITYELKKLLVPVEYEKVDKAIENIWKNEPELVIHCGANKNAKCIELEKLANNKFCEADYAGKLLKPPKVCLENHKNCDKLYTKLDIKEIISNLCEDICLVKENQITCSTGIGYYLCSYIYLKSLDKNNKKVLFIHVPPIDKPLSSKQACELIFDVIKQCLNQLEESHR